jgi:zinc transporter 1/2/3
MATTAMQMARLVLRQETEGPETLPDEPVSCEGSNEYDGRMGTRISAIFVILVASAFGENTPLDSSTYTNNV